ncbi:MAG: hypothetical protein CGU28_10350 [Candidatus Dactylopiibacterium carminicum]|uniref:YebB family permuted papain-like enzyme n=2 Tax=Candidatus Dactylopiibacterium carminicum TaxID=857335 RepID=A0A272ES05_9RHOO|nr:hypothetical protein BGI27_01050 [Candidatus Dactylopiibacterium carminicum]PAS92490.1 MAG: hypothetical protein CGU29_11435 [Candidatus Dactylopiibacterium carminicum]PAS96060.1 MAG: hypothetical protein CGU28_10350 [Candidatus Dactylopiibacterium carminicum]
MSLTLGLSAAPVLATPAAAAADGTFADTPLAAPAVDSIRIGDLIFIHVTPLPFEKVSQATGSWTNHVGIVVDVVEGEPVVAESTFPRSKMTRFSAFVARSAEGRYAVRRLNAPLDDTMRQGLLEASRKRMGIFYDTGFNLDSSRQFCSRFVHEVLQEAIGVQVGESETFRELLARNPETELGFWRAWYFGFIPWERTTITPASLYHSPTLITVTTAE